MAMEHNKGFQGDGAPRETIAEFWKYRHNSGAFAKISPFTFNQDNRIDHGNQRKPGDFPTNHFGDHKRM
jgi:hypothetical protein